MSTNLVANYSEPMRAFTMLMIETGWMPMLEA